MKYLEQATANHDDYQFICELTFETYQQTLRYGFNFLVLKDNKEIDSKRIHDAFPDYMPIHQSTYKRLFLSHLGQHGRRLFKKYVDFDIHPMRIKLIEKIDKIFKDPNLFDYFTDYDPDTKPPAYREIIDIDEYKVKYKVKMNAERQCQVYITATSPHIQYTTTLFTRHFNDEFVIDVHRFFDHLEQSEQKSFQSTREWVHTRLNHYFKKHWEDNHYV